MDDPYIVDIIEHLPTLTKLANEVKHVTEFGVRTGNSTRAFLEANIDKLISYDIYDFVGIDDPRFEFKKESSLDIDIEDTDLLMIDTEHVYKQLMAELNRHHSKVRKYIILHDTVTFGDVGSDGGEGLLKAVREFLVDNKDWYIYRHYKNCNGLMVLRKKQ